MVQNTTSSEVNYPCTMPEKSLRLEERDGIANPLETVSIIKSLQRTLNTVEVELTKCPETD